MVQTFAAVHSFSHVFHEARTGKCRLLYHFQPGDAEFHAGHQPEIQGTRFIDPEKLKNKKNVRVRVVRKGLLFGMEGQFVRYGGRHYIAIQVSGSAALLRVSYTWCELIEEI